MKSAADWRFKIQIHEYCARCEVSTRLEIHIQISIVMECVGFRNSEFILIPCLPQPGIYYHAVRVETTL